MAGPIAGIGQQQIPVSTALQQSGGAQPQTAQGVRTQEEQKNPKQETIQGQNTAAGQAQGTETKNTGNLLQQQLQDALSGNQSNDNELNADARRGSLVDVTV